MVEAVSNMFPSFTNSFTNSDEYVVKSGDNLWNIAKNHGISLKKLRELNPQQKGDTIHVGDKLRVKDGNSSQGMYAVDIVEEEKKEKEYNKSNASAIFNFKHTGSFIVVDKANARLTVYDKNNNPLFTTTNIASGASGNDYNTITYTDDSGELKDMMGNNSTPAGITYIGSISDYHGLPSFTRQRQNRDGSREDIASSMHYSSNTSKAHLSNGCIRVGGKDMKEIAKYVSEGTPIYVLPEKPGSKFVLRAGKLNYVADNPYGVDTGEKKLWDDYNVYIDKSYNPITIELKNRTLDPNYNHNATVFAETISRNKYQLQKQFNLSNYEYNKLSQLAMGIADQESKFGTSTKYKMKNGVSINQDLIAVKHFFVDHLIKGKPLVSNSRGITQIKYGDDVKNKELQNLYNQFGIHSGDDLDNIENSAKATMIRLAFIYNSEIKGRNFTDAGNKPVSPWDALLYTYNGTKYNLRNKSATPELNRYIKNINRYANNFKYTEYRY